MRVASLLLASAIAGCTPGAPPAGAGSGVATTTIDVSLTSSTVTPTAYGNAGGYAPVVTAVPLGSTVRFLNVDAFSHTATSLSGTAFPPSSPFGTVALNVFGNTLSGGWSSGTLAAGAASQPLLADQRGTYLYGCFFHYGSPMRGALVVQ